MTFPVAFTGDHHYGCTTHSSVDPETNLPTRLLDFERSIKGLFAKCEELGIRGLVNMGDLYHVANPISTWIARSIALYRQCLAGTVQVFAYDGNHDWAGRAGRKNATASLVEALGEHQNFAWYDAPEMIEDWAPGIRVLVVPHGSPPVDVRFPDDSCTNLVFAHTTIEGAVSGAEETLLADKVRDLGKIEGRVDAYFTGHIHKPQMFRYRDSLVVYPGSIERIDFGERTEEKSFVVADLHAIREKGEGAITRVPLVTRPMIQVEYLLDEPDGGGFTPFVGQGQVKDALVKVVVRGREASLLGFDAVAVRKALLAGGANYVSGFSMDIERERAVKDAEMTERLTVSDALTRYIDRNIKLDTDEDRRFAAEVQTQGRRILLEAQRASP